MGCKERDLPVQALYWWKSREVTRVPQAKRDAARSHVLWSLDCEQSLFGPKTEEGLTEEGLLAVYLEPYFAESLLAG